LTKSTVSTTSVITLCVALRGMPRCFSETGKGWLAFIAEETRRGGTGPGRIA
jgi:hypothetical protein